MGYKSVYLAKAIHDGETYEKANDSGSSIVFAPLMSMRGRKRTESPSPSREPSSLPYDFYTPSCGRAREQCCPPARRGIHYGQSCVELSRRNRRATSLRDLRDSVWKSYFGGCCVRDRQQPSILRGVNMKLKEFSKNLLARNELGTILPNGVIAGCGRVCKPRFLRRQ